MNTPLHQLPRRTLRVHRSATSSAVRDVVKNWDGRTLRVHSDGDLLAAYKSLKAHEASLYDHSPHAPRLLGNLKKELTNRGLLPC